MKIYTCYINRLISRVETGLNSYRSWTGHILCALVLITWIAAITVPWLYFGISILQHMHYLLPLVPSTCSLEFKVPHLVFSERLTFLSDMKEDLLRTTALCCAVKLVTSGKIKFVLLGIRKLLPKVPHQFYANLALKDLVSYHNKRLRRWRFKR